MKRKFVAVANQINKMAFAGLKKQINKANQVRNQRENTIFFESTTIRNSFHFRVLSDCCQSFLLLLFHFVFSFFACILTKFCNHCQMVCYRSGGDLTQSELFSFVLSHVLTGNTHFTYIHYSRTSLLFIVHLDTRSVLRPS